MGRIATQIPENLFDHVAQNAGVILSSFDPENWTVSRANIIGATTGGINFTDTPTYTDYGDDIDNCPKNVKELKRLDNHEVKASGTYVSITPEQVKALAAAADVSAKTVTPRNDLKTDDFEDIWFVCDYGTDNAIAIEMKNVLSTGGFAFQTTDKGKSTFAFEYTAHYSMDDPDEVPYKVYFKA